MKKSIVILSMLFFASCGSSITESTAPVVEDVNPDVTALFVQACENKDASCKQLLCNKVDAKFVCSDNPLGENKTCGEEKSYDEIVNSYTICSDTQQELLTHNIYNYSEKKNEFFESMTPNEMDAKIAEELAIIESGGESEWMSTLLASAGGALIGGIIANKLFGGGAAQVPPRSNNTENVRTVNKDSLNQVKQDSATQTQQRVEKRKEAIQKARADRKLKESKTKQQTRKKTTSKKRRR